MTKIDFIESAYQEIRLKAIDPAFADTVRGQPLLPHLHSRSTFLHARGVTLRLNNQDYGVPALFPEPLAALTFHNAVRAALKKMPVPIP